MFLLRWLIITTVLVPLLRVEPISAATEVTSCDQEYRGTAYLSGNLDCSGSSLGHLRFNRRGKLLLKGFTLTGGVRCATCSVIGPGTITGSVGAAVRGTIKATVANVTVTGNDAGVVAQTFAKQGMVVIRNSIITGNRFHGVEADRVAKIRDSTISGNGLNGIKLPCDGKSRVTVRDSTLSDNGGDPVCGDAITCADIATCGRPPRLTGDVSCETSYVLGTGVPGTNFGICSLD